jgi:hypothetical protein
MKLLLGSFNGETDHHRPDTKLCKQPVSPFIVAQPGADSAGEPRVLPRPCRSCGGRMIIIETFARGCQPKHHPAPAPAAIRIDTS